MDDQRCASVAEQRMAVAAEGYIFVVPFKMRSTIRARREVGIVTGVVTFRILQSMLFPVRIEMRPGRLEVRGIATRILMKVDGMFAGRQMLEIDFHPYSGGVFPNDRGPHGIALSILELNHSLGGTGRGERQHDQGDWEQTAGFHGTDYSESGWELRGSVSLGGKEFANRPATPEQV